MLKPGRRNPVPPPIDRAAASGYLRVIDRGLTAVSSSGARSGARRSKQQCLAEAASYTRALRIWAEQNRAWLTKHRRTNTVALPDGRIMWVYFGQTETFAVHPNRARGYWALVGNKLRPLEPPFRKRPT